MSIQYKGKDCMRDTVSVREHDGRVHRAYSSLLDHCPLSLTNHAPRLLPVSRRTEQDDTSLNLIVRSISCHHPCTLLTLNRRHFEADVDRGLVNVEDKKYSPIMLGDDGRQQ